MVKKIFLILVISLIASIEPVSAQRRSPSKSANQAFERKQYNVAIERYKKAYKKTGKKRYRDEREFITFRLAECYRLTESMKLAEAQYKRLVKTEFPKETL